MQNKKEVYYFFFICIHVMVRMYAMRGETGMKVKEVTKTVIGKTLLFVIILVFISVYKKLIGDENALVAVTILVELMVLLGYKLTEEPVKNTCNLLGTSLFLAFAAYFAVENIYIGLILNFIAITGIAYFYSYTMTKSLIVPFGLQYFFMVYNFVEGELFLKRILGIVVGVVLIMSVQYVMQYILKRGEKVLEEEKATSMLAFEEKLQQKHIRKQYALRIGVVSAIVMFVVEYFHIVEGRWIVYTIFSLTELYAEQCKVRAKQRLRATLLGVAIVIILFILIKDSNARFLILLAAGYLNCYFSNYKDTMVIATVCAVTSEAIATGTIAVAFIRIAYVIVGTVLALLANHFLFRPTIKQ